MKQCTKCKEFKNESEFGKQKCQGSGLRPRCKKCHSEDCKQYRENNPEKVLESKKKYRDNNYEKTLKQQKKYRDNNKEKERLRGKKYRDNNKDKINEYQRKLRQNNINIRLTKNIRRRVLNALNSITKSAHTLELLGCSIDTFKKHLQETAIQNGYTDFTIDNFSGYDYHIDHIIPCSSFNLEDPEQQKLCFHYTNQQILSAKENLSKGNRI